MRSPNSVTGTLTRTRNPRFRPSLSPITAPNRVRRFWRIFPGLARESEVFGGTAAASRESGAGSAGLVTAASQMGKGRE
jgi:hypothetical protein